MAPRKKAVECPPPFLFGQNANQRMARNLPRAPLPVNEQCHDVSDGGGTDQDHIISRAAINELIFARTSTDRVIAALSQ